VRAVSAVPATQRRRRVGRVRCFVMVFPSRVQSFADDRKRLRPHLPAAASAGKIGG
jgi:hypothetical protein